MSRRSKVKKSSFDDQRTAMAFLKFSQSTSEKSDLNERTIFMTSLLGNIWGDRWSDQTEMMLINPPTGFVNTVIEFFAVHQGQLKLYVVQEKKGIATTYVKQDWSEEISLSAFEDERKRHYTVYAGLAIWPSQKQIGDVIIQSVERLERHGRFLISNGKYNGQDDFKSSVSRLGLIEVLPTARLEFTTFSKDSSEWERLRAGKLTAVTTLPLDVSSSDASSHPTIEIATEDLFIERTFYYPEGKKITEDHFAPYHCKASAKLRLVEDVLMHGGSGCVFAKNNIHISETSQWIRFQDHEVPCFYANAETGWRVWQYDTFDVAEMSDHCHFLALGAHPENFYHWLIDIGPKIWIFDHALRAGLITTDTRLVVPPLRTQFQRDFIAMLKLPSSQIVEADPGFMKFSKACVPALYDTHKEVRWRGRPMQFYNWLRRATSSLSDNSVAGSDYVYLSRSDTNKRVLNNENEVITLLETKGFEIFSPGGKSLAQQVAAVRNAKIVIGSHGAGLTNIVFSPPESILGEIRTDKISDNGYRLITGLRKSNYACFKAESLPQEGRSGPDQDIYVDVEQFSEFVDALKRRQT